MNHCRKHLLSEQASFNPRTRFVELDKIWRRTGFAMSTKGPSFRPDTPYNIGEGQIPAAELVTLRRVRYGIPNYRPY